VAILALALQASRPISAGEEVLYAYGEAWWLSRGANEGDHDGAGSGILAVGSALPPRAESDRLRRALGPRLAKGASKKAGAKAKLRKKGASPVQPKKGAAKGAAKGFGAPPA
jgi:hypothetical protein